jgi:hypothetical protein
VEYSFDKSQKILSNFFHFVTHYEIVNVRHKKSSNRNGQLHFFQFSA